MYVISNKELGRQALVRAQGLGLPHPGCFAKRGCKLLILKGEDPKKSVKRLQLAECKELTLAGKLRGGRSSVELSGFLG
jgi:hypothetical protein